MTPQTWFYDRTTFFLCKLLADGLSKMLIHLNNQYLSY
jgi:hypothetical protein